MKVFGIPKNLRDICRRQIRPERSEDVFKKVLERGSGAEPLVPYSLNRISAPPARSTADLMAAIPEPSDPARPGMEMTAGRGESL